MEKIVKAFLETTVGMELETTTKYDTCGVDLSEWGSDAFNESNAIREYRLAPTNLSDFKSTLMMGELVRRATPYYFVGQADLSAGSAHCHLAIEEIENEVYEYITSESYEGNPYDLAKVMVTPSIQIMLLPFMSLGYCRRDVTGYPLRAPYRTSTLSNTVFCSRRGSMMKINSDVPYANYGFEFRENENSNLWMYLLPYLLYKFKTDKVAEKQALLLQKQMSMFMSRECIEPYNEATISFIFSEALKLLRSWLTNSELDTLVAHMGLTCTEADIFTAYVFEDYDKYDSQIDSFMTPSLLKTFSKMKKVIKANPFILSNEFEDIQYKRKLAISKLKYIRKYKYIYINLDMFCLKKALKQLIPNVIVRKFVANYGYSNSDALYINCGDPLGDNYISSNAIGDITCDLRVVRNYDVPSEVGNKYVYKGVLTSNLLVDGSRHWYSVRDLHITDVNFLDIHK